MPQLHPHLNIPLGRDSFQKTIPDFPGKDQVIGSHQTCLHSPQEKKIRIHLMCMCMEGIKCLKIKSLWLPTCQYNVNLNKKNIT